MFSRFQFRLLATTLVIFLPGCSSLNAHNDDWGHPYAGTQLAANGLKPHLAQSAIVLFIPAPFIILDVPFSLVMDTILLPADIFIKPKKARDDITYVPPH
jgi:uncharacterized protein YceK